MKILIVCYCYAPDPGPRAYRWSAIAEYWAARGHHVDVISGWKIGAARFERLNGVNVYRVSGAVTENLRLWIERRARERSRPEERLSPQALGGARFSGPAGALKRLHDLTWKKVYWPDSACLWFFPAWGRAKRLMAETPYDAVISTSTPYTGHLVGQRIKKRRPEVHWLVDIGDPFSFYYDVPWNNVALFDRLNRRSETKVLERADSVSVTVASCLAAYETHFPGVKRKTRVIPPVLASSVTAGEGPTEQRSSRAKRLVFAGTLYRNIRNPAYLLRLYAHLLDRRADLELHFFGRINDCADVFEPYAALLDKRIFLHGLVSRNHAVAAVASAHVLVNIGNTTAYQLPSKIVEYVSAAKPILNIVRGDADCSLAFLDGYPATLSVTESAGGPDEAEIARVLNFICSPPELPKGFLEAFLEPYRADAVAQRYLELIAGDAGEADPSAVRAKPLQVT